MAVCSHDMIFTYVYIGWEGTTNDSHVFLDALTRQGNDFPFPPDGNFFDLVVNKFISIYN